MRRLLALLFLLASVRGARAQDLATDPRRAMSGPWELVSDGKILGIFVTLDGRYASVQIYARSMGGSPTWGWYHTGNNGGATLEATI